MPLSPETLVFAVRALVRVGSAGREAYEQKVRDAPLRMPNLTRPVIDDDRALHSTFRLNRPLRERMDSGGDLAALWDGEAPKDDAARLILIEESTRFLAEAASKTPSDRTWSETRFEQEHAGIVLLDQWAEGKGPPEPWARLALAVADVALDYVGANPGILGVGGNGERLIAAFGANLRALLPDADRHADWPGEAWGRFYFVERSLAIAMHAGFKTIAENPDTLVEEAHYRDLLKNVLTPLVDLYDGDATRLPRMLALRDTLLGPMTDAALKTLTRHQRAFMGDRFDPANTAVGAVTGAVLGAVAEGGLTDTFGEEGLVRVYQAALGVAVARPELFVTGDGRGRDLAREMLSSIAGHLDDAPPPFRKGIAADVAASVLQVAGRHAPRFFDPDAPWQLVAGNLVQEVMEGLSEGMTAGGLDGALDQVFSTDQAVELVTVVLEQAARTPGMVVGASARGEVKALAAVVANAMASRGAELLSSEAWLDIAAAAAEEVGRNPARLLKLDTTDPDAQLLGKLIKALMLTAADEFSARNGREGAPVLFGDTLAESIKTTLKAAGGKAEQADETVEALAEFTGRLNKLSSEQPGRVGAGEWRLLFTKYVARVLETGVLTDLTQDKLLGDLATEAAA